MTISPVAPTLSRGNRDHELAALVALLVMKRTPMDRLASEIEESGSAIAVLQRVAHENALAPVFGDSEIVEAVTAVHAWRERSVDVRIVFELTYPSNLRGIFNKPPLIFFKGTWDERRDAISIAVVGTRKPSPEGVRRAASAARRLASAGVTVLSGLAAGIDTAAHTAALEAGGRTVAVMGTGIDRVYPRENRELADRIVAAGGALASQFFPDQPPTQWTFPMRNVVMSGLSLATLVIEASETSGAKSQARHALQHGRAVFLPKSLVERYEWAQKMVTVGEHGVRAVQVDSPDDVVDRILGEPAESAIAI